MSVYRCLAQEGIQTSKGVSATDMMLERSLQMAIAVKDHLETRRKHEIRQGKEPVRNQPVAQPEPVRNQSAAQPEPPAATP